LLRFRAVSDQHEWAAVWRLTLCGLRRSEVMGMTWDCVDLERGEVKVEHGRVLLDGIAPPPMTRSPQPHDGPYRWRRSNRARWHSSRSLKARQATDRLLAGAAYQETGLVLVDPLGRPVRPELYSDRFRMLSRQAGLRPIHLHLVRHTLAVALNRAGVAIVDAAPLLGHTVDVYVSTYLRPSEQGARSAASSLGAALAGGS
jgi:integrase